MVTLLRIRFSGIHCRLPQLVGIHLSKSFVPLDLVVLITAYLL